MVLVLDKCFLFSLLVSFLKHLLYLSIRMESCDLWLTCTESHFLIPCDIGWCIQMKKSHLFCSMSETYDPCSKAVHFFSVQACKNNHNWAAYCFTSACVWAWSTLCPLSILKRGKHKVHFLRAVHVAKSFRLFYQLQCWEGVKRADPTR